MSIGTEDKQDNFSKASTAVIDDDESRSAVSIEKVKCIDKIFVTGYKHKITGITYFHAATQTVKPLWDHVELEKFCRDCQTVETKEKTQQTARDSSTQVQVRNIFIQTSRDLSKESITSSSEYVYADETEAELLCKILILQKFARRWLAEKKLKLLKTHQQQRLMWEEEQRKIRLKQDSEWFKNLQRRRLYPIAEDDFILLFSDLQNWWQNEAQIISETKSGTKQQDAMWRLVNEEVKKIEEINKTKKIVENRKVYDLRENLLIEAGKPKFWKAYKNNIPVITEGTQKRQNLQNLYTTLSMKYVSTQDRINALQSLIQLLEKYNNRVTNTLLQLAQREVDLLLRGTKIRNLEGLRSRIQDLFWQCMKQPMFNPELHNLHRLKDGNSLHMLCCSGCKQFYTLPASSVNEVVGKSVLGNCFVKCKKCLYLENEGWIRKDTELYKKILKLLIEEEEKKSSISSLIYILQPCDIKHLVETIWKRQSCLSGAADDTDLEFVRYNIENNWTPWNCLLVTREEAAIISKIPNPKATYDEDFKKFVYQRHVIARSYFATIPRFLPFITKSILTDYKDLCNIEEV